MTDKPDRFLQQDMCLSRQGENSRWCLSWIQQGFWHSHSESL